MEDENVKNNKVHLCNSCSRDYPECQNETRQIINILFGDGKGNDNICSCNLYFPITIKYSNRH